MRSYASFSIAVAVCGIAISAAGCGSHADVQPTAPPGPASSSSQQAGQQAAQRAAQQAAAMQADKMAHPNGH